MVTFALVALGVIVLVVGAVLAMASTRPGTFRIERSLAIAISADRVFPLIDDLHAWESWSPWDKKDPALKRTYGGSSRGVGAVYEWLGNKNVGQGRMEITKSVPSKHVVIQLDFLKPFEAHNIAEFTLEPRGGETIVTWAMHGPQLFMGKVMSLFMSMDQMIGKDFEQGLSNLKAIAEKNA